MKCSLCQSPKLIFEFSAPDFDTGKLYRLYRCRFCLSVHTFPRLPPAKLKSKYLAYRDRVNGGRFKLFFDRLISVWHRRRVAAVNRFFKHPGRILDIGCGRAIELKEFKKLGWEVLGTELSGNSVADIPVIPKNIWQLPYSSKHFNAVLFHHSLEHLSSPGKALSTAVKLLKPGGILVVAVPNFDNMERKLFGSDWFHLDIPRHFTHFSAASLEKWANKNKLKISKRSSLAPEYDFYSVLQSSLNLLPFFPKNLFYNFLLKRKRLARNKKLLLVIQLPLIAVFSAICLPLTFTLWMAGQSGTIEYYFQKP